MRSKESRLLVTALVTAVGVAIPAAVRAQDLSDPQVAHVAVTANTIDAELAKLALQRAQSDEVKAFAQTMLDDHTGVNRQAAALATKLKVTPATNDVSTSLQKGAADARAKLEKLRGSAFDRAYMTREVEYHKAVLDAIDNLLIPTTQNGELRELLKTVRPAIAAHLQRAQRIQQSVTQ